MCDSVFFWRVYPWVLTILVVLAGNGITLFYATTYFSYDDEVTRALC